MLVPPTFEEYEESVLGAEVPEQSIVEYVLMQATDLMWLATGLQEYPEDERLNRIVHSGILEMARYLLVQDDSFDKSNGGLDSETIGSYSYSRSSKAKVSIQNGFPLGLFWFDLAASLFPGLDLGVTDQTVKISSEDVFGTGVNNFLGYYNETKSQGYYL